jgi:CDP-diglyceride synthetase
MLKHRLILGLFLSALFVAILWLDSHSSPGWPQAHWSTPPGFYLAIVCILVAPFAIWEMKNLLAREHVTISMRVTVVAALLCMLWPWLEQVGDSLQQKRTDAAHIAATAPSAQNADTLHAIESSPWYVIAEWFRSVKPHYLVPTILAIALVAAFIKHSRNQRVEGAMANAGGTLLAIVYLGVLPGFFLPICMTHSAWMVLRIVAVVKAADVGAYTTGRLLGKHKLIPWLSPGKTIEGFFGGLVFSGIVAALLALPFRPDQPRLTVLAIAAGCGIILGAIGQLGDLLESLLKRDAGFKDSGALPGFGGILDILDSPLLAAPVAYWLLKLVL